MATRRPRLIAHRGSGRAPENTLEAFARALDDGADGVELDVRRCGSGEVVVCHDPDLGRTGFEAAPIARLPYADLRRRPLRGGGRVPLLDEVLDLLAPAGVLVNVEVKHDAPDRWRLVAAVRRTLARRSAAERAGLLLSSFHPAILLGLAGLSTPRAFLFDGPHTGRVRGAVLRRLTPVEGLHPHGALCTARSVARWRRRGFVHAWTIDDPAEARRLAALGVDGLITDDVPGLARAFARS